MTIRLEQSKAIASDVRIQILDWLKEPQKYFSAQESADPVKVGVCNALITARLNMSQPTVSRHLEILRQAGLVNVQRIEKWSYYSRNEAELAHYADWVSKDL